MESNFITGEGIILILQALDENDCLEELRIDNQRQQFGNKVGTFIYRNMVYCNLITIIRYLHYNTSYVLS